MNALEFLVANADAVRKVWDESIVGRTLTSRYAMVGVDEGKTFKNVGDAWLVVNAYSKTAVYVHIVHKDVLRTANLSDFINGSTVSDRPTDREKALTLARLASVKSIRLPRNGVTVKRECVSVGVSGLFAIATSMRAAHPEGCLEYTLFECPTKFHQGERLYKIRKSVLLKEAGGSTAKEVTQRKPVMAQEIAAPYGRLSGRASARHENNSALPRKELGKSTATVPELINEADKLIAEDNAKTLASLDAMIASPTMPDACKTLLRGIRHQFERAATYDQAGGERSMDKIVPMFNILYGKDLTKEQGWMFMMLVKAVRSANGNYSADSYEDGGSYFGLADEDAKKERK